MKQPIKVIAWFSEITKDDIPLVGGKGANLGEMVQAKIPVPPGFIVTADAYFYFLEVSGIMPDIQRLLAGLNVDNTKHLQNVSREIKERISNALVPEVITTEIKKAYHQLGGGLVAVRSSATAEDLPEASFAGQQSTFLNIEGEKEVISEIQSCWASLFEPRAIFYREQNKFAHFQVGIAVPVQRMVQSETSGVLFTVEPVSSDRTKIIIEAIYGLGEAIVSGDVTPDLYILDKKTLKIIDKKIYKQEWQLVRNPKASLSNLQTNIKVPINTSMQEKQKLNDQDINALAKIGKRIESLYRSPQDIEWATQDAHLYIVQTRPVTTIKETHVEETLHSIEAEPLFTGIAASPGVATGVVRIITASQIDKVEKGDVLVAEMTTPDFVPAMKRVVAIITDRGGRTAHAAIVSRELGIPCVVGTQIATKTLTNKQEVTVDGSTGNIYKGRVTIETKEMPATIKRKKIKTRTKLYVNLANPEMAEEIAARDVDGVGLLRAEFMITDVIKYHPRYMLHEGKGAQFVTGLTRGISTFTKAFYPRPVVYRTTDFKTNEYRNLQGGDKYEELEGNPMIGYRGCSRYTKETEVLRLEIEAIKNVCQQYDNLYVMIPFVRLVDEMAKIKRFLISEGLYQFPNFKLWMMAEVPSNVFLIDKFIDTGIDGVSIGSNDLTQLILGIDRDNPKLAEQFDERNEAVLQAIEKVVVVSREKGITCSICGQGPSVYPELTENLVKWGITSISVTPDMIDVTRQIIAAAEEKQC